MFALKHTIIFALISSSCLAAPHIHGRGYPGGNWGGKSQADNSVEGTKTTNTGSTVQQTNAPGGSQQTPQQRPSNIEAAYVAPSYVTPSAQKPSDFGAAEIVGTTSNQPNRQSHGSPHQQASASTDRQYNGAPDPQTSASTNQQTSNFADQEDRPSPTHGPLTSGQYGGPSNVKAAYARPSDVAPTSQTHNPTSVDMDSAGETGNGNPYPTHVAAAINPGAPQNSDECNNWSKRWGPGQGGDWGGHAAWLGHHVDWAGPPPGGVYTNPCVPPTSTYTRPTVTSTRTGTFTNTGTGTTNTGTTVTGTTGTGTTGTATTGTTTNAPTDTGYMAVVNEYRSKMGHSTLTMDSTLQGNAQKTVNDDQGTMTHELNPGSHAQVLAPAASADFVKAYVGGWLCEEPNAAGLDGICTSMSAGWTYDGTGHAEILNSAAYTNIGCAWAVGLWGCDLA